MPWVIRTDDDIAMAAAHAKWAKARAKKHGLDENDPQVDMLGANVWKPAFTAGLKHALRKDVLLRMAQVALATDQDLCDPSDLVKDFEKIIAWGIT